MLWRAGALRAYRGLGAALTLVLLVGCATGQPLVQLAAGRDAVAADGRGAPAPLSYSLSRAAAIDLYAVGPGGERFYLRRAESRPAGQDYQYLFDGTYPLPESQEERRVLPDGSYRLVIEAQAAGGLRQSVEAQVAVRNSDTSPPALTDLAVFPPLISPNFDGQDDAAAITYRLSERSRVAVYATDALGRRVYVGPQAPREAGEYRE